MWTVAMQGSPEVLEYLAVRGRQEKLIQRAPLQGLQKERQY